jgi:hypothetical protein
MPLASFRPVRALASAAPLLLVQLCWSAELRVPNDFSSIQAAINSSVTGDVVLIAPGEYRESVAIEGKSIQLRAEQLGSVVVHPQGNRCIRIVNVGGVGVEIHGIVFSGGSSLDGGAGLDVRGSVIRMLDVVIRGCRVPAGGVGFGGGMSAIDSTIRMERCSIIENGVDSSAVLTAAIGWRVIARGGGIHAVRSTLQASQCVFVANSATSSQAATWMEVSAAGGALCTIDSYAEIHKCRFERNRAEAAAFGFGPVARAYGGAAALSKDSGDGSEIDGCTFIANEVSCTSSNSYYNGAGNSLGGAVSVGHYTATPGASARHVIRGCAFVDQRALKAPLSGSSQVISDLARWEGESVSVTNCAFTGAWATTHGGAESACIWNRGGTADALAVSASEVCDISIGFSSGPVGLTNVVISKACADCSGLGTGDIRAIALGSIDVNDDWIPDSCQCIADLDGDGYVHGADLGVLLNAWGKAASDNPADLDLDGAIGGSDLGILLAAWGPC